MMIAIFSKWNNFNLFFVVWRLSNFFMIFSYNFQVAELVRTTIEGHTAPVPAILEIPSKDHPYDPTKDSILRRAKGMFNPQDF